MIPPDWKLSTLEELTEPSTPIRYGVVQIGPHVPNGIPIVPIKHIDRIGSAELHHASRDIEKKYKNSRVKGGDILLSVKGTIGRVGIVPEHFVGNIAREIARIRPNQKVEARFLAQLLAAAHTQRRIETATVGTTRREFSIATVRDFQVAVPSRKEQCRISDILTTWDRAIEATEKLIANSELQKRALMQQLLTGKKRLPGFHNDWKRKSLASLATIKKGTQKSKATLQDEGIYPVINGGVSPSGYTDESNTVAGTITISEGGNSCGYVSLIQTEFWSGGHCYTLNDLKINRDFLFSVLKWLEPKIMRLRVGSGLPNIQKGAISQLEIPLPEQAEQVAIADIMNDQHAVESAFQSDLERLKREKAALMQQLLTGKRRVKIGEEDTDV
ncbi:restriction endonuclease subunit S [Oricola indica]|uniref:restriction endonuclease subunit S n=1 Tax=Oricola indica TaxID=2872591 RepID=UPI001CBF74BC|nr:restriction endonuclease subunit S [Oricola indica]